MQTYINEKNPGIRTEDGGIKLFPTLLLTLYVAAASVFCTTSLLVGSVVPSEYFTLLLSVAMPIWGIAIAAKLTASIKPLIPYCIITALILFMGANLNVSSAIATSLLLIAAAAYLFHNKLWLLAVLACGASITATYMLTKNALVTACSAVFLPVAFALCLSFKKKLQRVGTVCAMSVTLGATLLLLLAAFIYSSTGSFSPAVIRGFFDSLRESLIVFVSDTLVAASAQLEATISTADALSVTSTAITMMFNLFPAVFTIVLFVISYVTHSLYISIISPTVDDQKEIIHAISFKMSVTSAILFLIAYFAALILDYEGLGLFAAAAQNIYLMLFPGLSLITFGFIGQFSKNKGASCLTSLLYFVIFGLILFIPGVAAEIAGALISISAFVGSVLVIVSAVKAKTKNNSNNDKK